MQPNPLKRELRARTSPADPVPSVQRALAVLELIGRSRKPMTLSVLSKQLSIPPSTLHGLTSTLVHAGYLDREERSKVYRLGRKVGELITAYHVTVDLVAAAKTAMDRVGDATGETVSLTVLEGTQIVFIDKRPGQGRVQVVNPVGTRLPAHATAAGKVMLAHLPEDETDRLYPDEALPALTPYTITSRSKLRRALARIRERRYAFDEQESELGLWAVAACIRDGRGAPAGAINIVAPFFRVRNRDCTDWRELVVKETAKVSEVLGLPPEADSQHREAGAGGNTHGSQGSR